MSGVLFAAAVYVLRPAGGSECVMPLELDQMNGDPGGSYESCSADLGSLFQSFTPTLSSLAAIDLSLKAGGQFPAEGYESTVYIRSQTHDGTILGSATATVRAFQYTEAVRYCFCPPISVTPGMSPVIEWAAPEQGGEVLSWYFRDDNPYPGGTAFSCAGDPAPEADFVFRTYGAGQSAPDFIRGDCNHDEKLNLADAICVLGYLFSGAANTCQSALDTTDDGKINIADAINLLGVLFSGAAPLPDPNGSCGPDPTPSTLPCEEFSPCPLTGSTPDLHGILHRLGTPMATITDVAPRFWFRNENTGQVCDSAVVEYDQDTSAYAFYNLPAYCGISVGFHVTGDESTLAGNYRQFKVWNVFMSPSMDIQILEILHLLQPFDNGTLLPSIGEPYPVYATGTGHFEWEAIAGAETYRVYLSRYRSSSHAEGYGLIETLVDASITTTSVDATLADSLPQEHYDFRVSAYAGGEQIAYYMSTAVNGYGWDLRFRIGDQ